MNFNIYKPGQGYYTRVMSGLGFGVLALYTAYWTFENLGTWISTEYALYIQSGVALVILAILGIILLNLLGTRPRTCDFLIATEGEMKKVNWPTRREVIGSTWVVIACMFLLVGFIFFVDIIFSTLFSLINVVHNPLIKSIFGIGAEATATVFGG